MPCLTTFLNGKLRLYQHKEGYRFSVDAPILADFITCRRTDQLLEIGSGNGIIPLILFKKQSFQVIKAVEIQADLVELAQKNVALNGAEQKIQVIHADIRTLGNPLWETNMDVVFSNPPYRRVGNGLLNPNQEKAIARHELQLNLEELMRGAARFCRTTGAFFMIHLAEREDDVCRQAQKAGFYLKKLRQVFSFPSSSEPRLILFHWEKKPCRTEKPDPLFIYAKENVYSNEFQRIISA